MRKQLFAAALAAVLMIWGCSKEQISPEKEVTQSRLKSTASINAGSVQQTVQGFGGASIITWIADLTSDQRTKAFSTSSGIGLSILRVMVPDNSANFAREKATIDAAKSYGAKVVATAWNAPSSMMSNLYLKTSSYANYAAHLKAYNTAVGGVYAISPWNEPDYLSSGWMHGTATEIANFVAAQGSNCGAPIMAPEPFQMDQNFINTYLSNSTAKSKTSFVCGHIYGKTPYNLGNIGKSVWMTEHYTNSNISGNDWNNAMTAAKEISDCMNVGWSAYIWWYIRRSYGLIDENSNITKLGYVMAQFSRYIRPGYSKVSCTYNPTSGVYTTAYKSGSKLVIVSVNTNSATTYQPFSLSGLTVSSFAKYETSATNNCVYLNDVPVSNGAFGISQSARSVVTLVSK